MERYSLLETKHLSNQKLKLFKQIGSSAHASDYALANGCILSSDANSYYFTKTASDNGGVYGNLGFNSGMEYNVSSTMYGIRPCIYNYELQENDIILSHVDFYTIQKGYYPQKACNKKDTKTLEKKLKNCELIDTNYYYSTFENFNNIYYDGKDYYVRSLGRPHGANVRLSNNCNVKNDSVVWFKITPVIWYYDDEHKILISKDVLISGIPFDKNLSYNGNFDSTFLGIYLNENFSKEVSLDLYSKDYLLNLKEHLTDNRPKQKVKH